MKTCTHCGKENKSNRTKYCSAKCMDESTASRSYSKYKAKPPKETKVYGTEFFDWRDYPNTIII